MRKKKNKHEEIVRDYDKIKSKHLDKLATKMLKNDEKLEKLKEKNIKGDFLNLFQMYTFTLKNATELEDMLSTYNLDLSKAVIDTIDKNINADEEPILVANIEIQSENITLELTVNPKEFISTLEKNLSIFEKHEEYEMCSQILKNINYLKQKS